MKGSYSATILPVTNGPLFQGDLDVEPSATKTSHHRPLMPSRVVGYDHAIPKRGGLRRLSKTSPRTEGSTSSSQEMNFAGGLGAIFARDATLRLRHAYHCDIW